MDRRPGARGCVLGDGHLSTRSLPRTDSDNGQRRRCVPAMYGFRTFGFKVIEPASVCMGRFDGQGAVHPGGFQAQRLFDKPLA